jgi:ABC-2 type transport system permease protein
MRKAANIYWLGIKELRSFLRDFVLLALVVYAFSLAVIMQARSNSQELHNASIAIVDEDHSELSRRIAHAFMPPLFQPPQPIVERDIVPSMNAGKYTFVVDIPPNFQRDVLGERRPGLQIDVDATAMVQAGLGSGYAQQIITTEIADFLSNSEGEPLSTVNLDVRIAFNPNITTAWFSSVMAIINNVTMLAIILAGAAIVREREHGTMDHLLVMPLTPFEIAMSKVWANGLVITLAVGVSLYLVVRVMLGIPIAGSIPLFMVGVVIYLFCDRDRYFSRNSGAVNAATRTALYVGLSAHEHALGQQYPAREHAALACDSDAGIAVNAFRIVRAVNPLSRRRN